MMSFDRKYYDIMAVKCQEKNGEVDVKKGAGSCIKSEERGNEKPKKIKEIKYPVYERVNSYKLVCMYMLTIRRPVL